MWFNLIPVSVQWTLVEYPSPWAQYLALRWKDAISVWTSGRAWHPHIHPGTQENLWGRLLRNLFARAPNSLDREKGDGWDKLDLTAKVLSLALQGRLHLLWSRCWRVSQKTEDRESWCLKAAENGCSSSRRQDPPVYIFLRHPNTPWQFTLPLTHACFSRKRYQRHTTKDVWLVVWQSVSETSVHVRKRLWTRKHSRSLDTRAGDLSLFLSLFYNLT